MYEEFNRVFQIFEEGVGLMCASRFLSDSEVEKLSSLSCSLFGEFPIRFPDRSLRKMQEFIFNVPRYVSSLPTNTPQVKFLSLEVKNLSLKVEKGKVLAKIAHNVGRKVWTFDILYPMQDETRSVNDYTVINKLTS